MVLEAAGTPVGARKLGARGYLASIAWAATVLAGAQVVAVLPIDIVTPLFTTDALTRRSALLLIVLLSLVVIAAVSGLRATDGERGEVYACLLLVAVGELAVVFSRELFVAYAGMTLTLVAGFGILVVERREGRGVEAAVKHVVASAFMLVLFGLGLALVYLKTGATDVAAVAAEGGIGTLIVVVVVLEGMLAFPLHVARLDVLTGAPAYAGALLVGGRAIASTTLLIRLVEAGLGGPAASMLIPVTLLSLVVPGLVAVDQREIPRAAAHLFIGLGGYCKTVKRDGFVWDYSGHFFHFKHPEIERWLRRAHGRSGSSQDREEARIGTKARPSTSPSRRTSTSSRRRSSSSASTTCTSQG
jgi:NADH:ubiquinone oxidoreductase subunit 2 (subunit N)